MSSLEEQVNSIKSDYRGFFLKFADELKACVDDLKPNGVEGEIFDTYSENSIGKEWQKSVLTLINEGIATDIYKKLIGLKEYRKSLDNQCNGCGMCCKLAVSEFSPQELQQKADEGDNFATQFLSVFKPYKTKEEAQRIYPEYFDLIKNTTDNNAYFYHCPKVTSDNRCPDYENRPQICKDFPDNPLAFLPKTCGFQHWKDTVQKDTIKLQAMVEIIEFYKEKLGKL